MTDKKTFKGFPLDSRGDVIGAFPTVDVIQERTKDLMNEVTGNINQMTIDYCLKFNIDPDVLIKQKAEIELLQMKIKELKETDEYIIQTLESKVEKLQEDLRNKRISIKNKKAEINELKLELTVEKDQHQEEINLHLHAEDYIKSLEKENKTLEGCLLAEQEHTQMLEQQIEKMQEKLKADLIADLKERIQYSTSPSCTKGMELFIRSIEEWEIKENGN